MRKTPVWQYILLVVLLGGLGFGVVRMMNGMGQSSAPPRRPAPGPATATDTPDTPLASGSSGADVVAKTLAARQNPNLFKVFQLEAPRNPFTQKEEWYAESLDKLPGYPELKDDEFLNTMDPYLPDLDLFYQDPDQWKSVNISKSTNNTYSFAGTSDDGQIATSITLEKDIPTNLGYSWDKESGVPLSALKNPQWVEEQIRRESEGASEGPFDDTSDQGLPIPGLFGPNSQDSNAAYVNGDTFACYGVSSNNDRTAALIMYNGQPRLVQKGMVLPTHYMVLEINADGVVMVDLKDDSTVWVPLAE